MKLTREQKDLLAVVIAAIVVGLIFLGACIGTFMMLTHDVLGVSTPQAIVQLTDDERTMILITNSYRTSHGLNELINSQELMVSSQVKADDICTTGNWSHSNSKGQPFYIFIQQSGYNYTHAGENLVKGYKTEQLAFSALLNSPKHLENIVGDYKDIGVGINYCGGKNYIAIHYGK